MSFSIRQAEVSDLDEIYAIWSEGVGLSAEPLNREHRAFFEQRLQNQDAVFRVWVAVDESCRVLGWQSLFPMRNNPLFFTSMAESSSYVGASAPKGVGRALMRTAMDHAKTSPIQFIIGFVAIDNVVSLKMTDKMGFRRMCYFPSGKNYPARVLVSYAVPSVDPSQEVRYPTHEAF